VLSYPQRARAARLQAREKLDTCWDDDTSDWAKPGRYVFTPAARSARAEEAAKAAAAGPRTYKDKGGPDVQRIDPRKRIESQSKNPIIIAVDVTGSMQTWPFEIFDRLPLLYNTLSGYRADTEICFAAIGDAGCDNWPLQVTDFSKGFSLEDQLKTLYGEGGGGDMPESYGLFALWADTHVKIPNADHPFMIVFGDADMHPTIPGKQTKHFLGDGAQEEDSIKVWNRLANKWNIWFLRRPGGSRGDGVDKQWGKAIGKQQVVHITDELRAVDYAMGLIARSWGHFGDFKENMAARQDESKIAELEATLRDVKPRVLACPKCTAPIPVTATGRFECAYCHSTLEL
jgi:hypothetical protein